MSDLADSERDTTGAADAGQPVGDLLELAKDRAVPVIRAIPDDLLTAPTPCSEYDVHTLVNHLHHVLVQFQGLARRENSEFGTPPDYVGRGADWRDRFAAEAGNLVAAWSQPGAEEGTTGRLNLPARTVGSMALLDLTVHAWDLARATGQDFSADPKALAMLFVLRDLVADLGPAAREQGFFGAPVPLPEDGRGATDLDVLLAQTGRDPGWAPPAGV